MRLRLSLVATALMLVLASCGSGNPPTPPQGPEPSHIVFLSDSSVIFTAAGQTAYLDVAVVRTDGTIAEDALLEFESSEPAVVGVNAAGEVIALTESVGSAAITIRSGQLEPVVASVIIAKLSPAAVLIPYDLVMRFDPVNGEVALARSTLSDSVAEGSILVSGDRAGLLQRVTKVSVASDSVEISSVPATLVEAFQSLDIELSGVAVDVTSELSDAGGPSDDSVSPASTLGLECKAEGNVVDVQFAGTTLSHELKLSPALRLKIEDSVVEHLQIYVEGVARVTATIGEVVIQGGAKGSIVCQVKLTSIPLGYLPVLGPLGLGLKATPAYGVELEAEYALATVKLNGPRVDFGTRSKMGLGYTAGSGFETISEREDLGDGFSLVGGEHTLSQELGVSIEPFHAVDVGFSANLGPFPFVGFDFLRAKVFGGMDLSMRSPTSPSERGYRGPEWELYAGASADLDSLLNAAEAVKRFFEFVGIPGADSFVDVDLTLFDVRRSMARSPRPSLLVTPSDVEAGEVVTLELDAPGADRARVEFVAFTNNGPAEPLEEATTNSSGSATATWVPREDDAGELEIGALLYHGVFGAIGVPYGVDETLRLVVNSGSSFKIVPGELKGGEVGVPYEFVLEARGLHASSSPVMFVWDFGDGTTGSRVEPVVAGKATTTISRTYAEDGLYYLTAAVNDANGELGSAYALVLIGAEEPANFAPCIYLGSDYIDFVGEELAIANVILRDESFVVDRYEEASDSSRLMLGASIDPLHGITGELIDTAEYFQASASTTAATGMAELEVIPVSEQHFRVISSSSAEIALDPGCSRDSAGAWVMASGQVLWRLPDSTSSRRLFASWRLTSSSPGYVENQLDPLHVTSFSEISAAVLSDLDRQPGQDIFWFSESAFTATTETDESEVVKIGSAPAKVVLDMPLVGTLVSIDVSVHSRVSASPHYVGGQDIVCNAYGHGGLGAADLELDMWYEDY